MHGYVVFLRFLAPVRKSLSVDIAIFERRRPNMLRMNATLKFLLRIRNVGFVLMGHGFTDYRTDDYIELEHTDMKVLRTAIENYLDLGFEFISIKELIALSQNDFKCDRNWIHLTFDDGYRNIYTLVYTYLREKGIPFSLFISTNHIARGKRFYVYLIRCALLNTRKSVDISSINQALSEDAPREERIQFCQEVIKIFKEMDKSNAVEFIKYTDSLLSQEEWSYFNGIYLEEEVLTVDQVKELANDESVHIGSHNYNHITLNQNVSEADIFYEMQASKTWLKENLNASFLTYCYPGGGRNDFTPNSKSICQKLGYDLAFTTIPKFVSPETDKYELPRLSISISHSDFERRLVKHFLPDYIVNLVRSLKHIYQTLT